MIPERRKNDCLNHHTIYSLLTHRAAILYQDMNIEELKFLKVCINLTIFQYGSFVCFSSPYFPSEDFLSVFSASQFKVQKYQCFFSILLSKVSKRCRFFQYLIFHKVAVLFVFSTFFFTLWNLFSTVLNFLPVFFSILFSTVKKIFNFSVPYFPQCRSCHVFQVSNFPQCRSWVCFSIGIFFSTMWKFCLFFAASLFPQCVIFVYF